MRRHGAGTGGGIIALTGLGSVAGAWMSDAATVAQFLLVVGLAVLLVIISRKTPLLPIQAAPSLRGWRSMIMRPKKQPKPAGACSVCQALTRRHENLNHRCDQVVNGRRCSGTFKSAMTFLWDQCESCEAAGKVGTQTCRECAGFGWKMYG